MKGPHGNWPTRLSTTCAPSSSTGTRSASVPYPKWKRSWQICPRPRPGPARLINFLQEVFEAKFSFDLEGLHKKGLKESARQLAKHQAANEYVVAWVVQHTLGGHAVPLDPPTLRVARRFGLLDGDQEDLEAARSSLEHLIPKSRGSLFGELTSSLAAEVCWEEVPQCADCPLNAECPSSRLDDPREDLAVSSRATRSKPR